MCLTNWRVLLFVICLLCPLDNDYNNLLKRGQEELDHFRFPQAAEVFSQAIALQPKNPKGYYYRSLALFNRVRFDDALKDINTCISLDKTYPSAFTLRGQIYFGMKDYDHSIADFTEAISINSKDTYAVSYRGEAFLAKREYANAIKNLKRAIEVDPKNGQGYLPLVEIYATCPDAKFRDGKRALELAQKAREIGQPESPFVVEAIASAYAELGNFEEAVKWEKKGG